jgi:hypothetical protein
MAKEKQTFLFSFLFFSFLFWANWEGQNNKKMRNNGKIKIMMEFFFKSIYKLKRQINKYVLGSTLVPCKEMNE